MHDIQALSVGAVALRLGVSRQTVYEEIRGGRLRSFRMGRRRLISVESLIEFIAWREQEAMKRSRHVQAE